jgi:hypothetical protein
MQLQFDFVPRYPYLQEVVDYIREDNPVHIFWSDVPSDLLYFADLYISTKSAEDVADYLLADPDEQPPSDPEWGTIHTVLCGLGCYAGCPG